MHQRLSKKKNRQEWLKYPHRCEQYKENVFITKRHKIKLFIFWGFESFPLPFFFLQNCIFLLLYSTKVAYKLQRL